MNSRKLICRTTRLAVPTIAGFLVACASPPRAPEMSILDVIDSHERMPSGQASCAALNVAAVCEKSTRLGSGRNCQCVDPRALTDGMPRRL